MAPTEQPPFDVVDGAVNAPFEASEREIVQDLYGVVDAVNLKPVRLTKSGIPPKPLWNGINQRLIWKDPSTVLYDWEEADQVRLTYLLARHLDLVRPDGDDWLHTGAGGDHYFLTDSLTRARLLLRAYLQVYDWDERCDARDHDGHRSNFGQAFRRDFIYDALAFRRLCVAALGRLPGEGWVDIVEIARALSEAAPDLLLSEVCDLPELDEPGVDPEVLRFLGYWFTLLGRFGWTDVGRLGGADGRRVCRLTSLGAALFKDRPYKATFEPEIHIDGDLRMRALGNPPSASARFVAQRIGRLVSAATRSRPAEFALDRGELEAAAASGVDIERAWGWMRDRLDEPLPVPLGEWVNAIVAARPSVRLVESAVALEVDPADSALIQRLTAAGFDAIGGIVTASALRAPDLFAMVGGEPFEGFDYPTEEPMGTWRPGPTLQLLYGELPLTHRDLIVALEPEGDPPALRFTGEKLARLVADGWTLESLDSALAALTRRAMPAKIRNQLQSMLG